MSCDEVGNICPAGLRYQGEGIAVEGAVRGLLAHEDEGYREWGASGSVRIDPGASGRGLSLTLSPTWGAAASGTERLWGLRDASGLGARDGEFDAERRLDAEVGYGFSVLDGRGVATPYAGWSRSSERETLRLGRPSSTALRSRNTSCPRSASGRRSRSTMPR